MLRCKNHRDRDVAGACVYCGQLFCDGCLVEINGKMYCKEHIGKVLEENNKKVVNDPISNTQPSIIVNNSSNGSIGVQRNKGVALILCFFLGWLGAHRFYTGKIFTGIIYAFTLGLGGIGIAFDFIFIFIGAYRDKSGFPLT